MATCVPPLTNPESAPVTTMRALLLTCLDATGNRALCSSLEPRKKTGYGYDRNHCRGEKMQWLRALYVGNYHLCPGRGCPKISKPSPDRHTAS